MKTVKRTIATLLTALLLLTMVPFSTFTASADTLVNPAAVNLEIYDVQTPEYLGDGRYKIPEFTYQVTFDDGSTIIKSSLEKDEKLQIYDSQDSSPWSYTGKNYFSVWYDNLYAQVEIDLYDGPFTFDVEKDGVYITGYDSSAFTSGGVLKIPAVIAGIKVVGLYYVDRNTVKVVLPETVKKIGKDAFRNASALKTITVSAKNKYFSAQDGVLYNKAKTKMIHVPTARKSTITIPKTVTNVDALLKANSVTIALAQGSKTFSFVNNVLYNKAKTKIYYVNKKISGTYTMPKTVKEVADCAFMDCDKLTKVVYSNKVTNIAYYTFADCAKLKTVKLPTKLTKIEENAFAFCKKLSSADLPATLKTIDEKAFYQCSALKTVTLPKGLKKLGSYSFKGTGIKSITIPANIKEFGDNVFNGCESLTNVKLPANMKEIMSGTFKDCTSLKKITIPAKVTTIYHNAFSGCTALNNVVIPKNVTEIYSGAFSCCTSLESIVIPKKITIIYPNTFEGCSSLKSVSLPDGLKEIRYSAFYACEALTAIDLPAKVEVIESYAFFNTGLKEFSLPKLVKELQDGTLSSCDNLEKLTIGAGLIYFSENTIRDCPKLNNIQISASNKYYSAQGGVVYNKSKTEAICAPSAVGYGVKLSPKTKNIIAYAFKNNTAVKTVEIPNSVTSIAYYAFSGCSNLTTVKLPSGLKSIEEATFERCKNLRSVTIPKSVKEIHTSAFSGCKKLKYVYYAGTKAQWEDIEIEKWGNGALTKAKIYYNSKGCSHKYGNGATLSCTVCGYVNIDPTIKKIKGKWYYYNNGQKQTAFTGMVTIKGVKRFIKKGVVTSSLDQPNVKLTTTATGVKLSWNKVPAATRYKVYRSVYTKGKWSDYKYYATTTSTSYENKLSSGTRVRYTVYACNSTHSSKFKAGVITTYLAAGTAKLTKEKAGIKITWKKVAGAKGYAVYRREFKNGKWGALKLVKKTTKTNCINANAKKGVKYQYVVRPYSGSSYSAIKYSTSIIRK